MGLRFRKSVSLGKGMRINFSKSGASMSLFGQLAAASLRLLEKRGAYLNIGIPGTGTLIELRFPPQRRGIYEENAWWARRMAAEPMRASSLPRAVSMIQYTAYPNLSATVSLSEEGEFTFKDKDEAGRSVTTIWLALSSEHLNFRSKPRFCEAQASEVAKSSRSAMLRLLLLSICISNLQMLCRDATENESSGTREPFASNV